MKIVRTFGEPKQNLNLEKNLLEKRTWNGIKWHEIKINGRRKLNVKSEEGQSNMYA